MRQVSSEEVAAHQPHVESLAKRFNGNKANAEYDDLVQEGLIAVWQCLREGVEPGPGIIKRRMLNWCRYLMRHSDNLSYDEVVGDINELVAEPV